jgi:hypothetical protein
MDFHRRVPLIRFPLLPTGARLELHKEPLLMEMMRQNDRTRLLGMQMLTECQSEFAQARLGQSDCPRLRHRTGSDLGFTKFSADHYTVGEHRALLTCGGHRYSEPADRVALCQHRVMASGKHCARFTIVKAGYAMVGLARPDVDVEAKSAFKRPNVFCVGENGRILDGSAACCQGLAAGLPVGRKWPGTTQLQWRDEDNADDDDDEEGDGTVLSLLLDMDVDTLTIKKEGGLCGSVSVGGGEWCWAVAMSDVGRSGGSVRIQELNVADF